MSLTESQTPADEEPATAPPKVAKFTVRIVNPRATVLDRIRAQLDGVSPLAVFARLNAMLDEAGVPTTDAADEEMPLTFEQRFELLIAQRDFATLRAAEWELAMRAICGADKDRL